MEWWVALLLTIGIAAVIALTILHLVVLLDEKARDRWELLLKFFFPFGGAVILVRRKWKELSW